MCLVFTEHMILVQVPNWHEVGTHVEARNESLATVSDGFYYVSLLSSIEALLSNHHVLTQV